MNEFAPLLRIIAVSRTTPESTVYLLPECARCALVCCRHSRMHLETGDLSLFQGKNYILVRTEREIPEYP